MEEKIIRVEEVVQTINDELNMVRSSQYDDIIKPTDEESEEFVVKDVYLMDDFCKYYDEEFIENIFYGILKRSPDENGKKTYLKMLRDGNVTKEMIILTLRDSPEGCAHNVNILGLGKQRFLKKLETIKPLQRISRLLYTFIRLPRELRRISKHANYTAQHLVQHTKNDLLLEEHILDLKADNTLLHHTIKSLVKEKAETEAQLAKTNQYMSQIQTNLSKITDMVSNNTIEDIKPIIQEVKTEQKNMLDLMYVAFEDKFRGSKEEIREKLEVYIPYIQQVENNTYVLDVGCGRGEWLKLLKENNISAKGLDLNSAMVVEAQGSGLDVFNEDVISYLKKQPDSSIDAITGFHIVEHLPFEVMITMLQESLRVLKTDGLVIFETPNPENVLVGAHYFYNDPTHKNPLVPVTMEFILQYIGFSSVEIKRLHTYAESAGIAPSEDAFVNNNFYNSMDFAIIGSKK